MDTKTVIIAVYLGRETKDVLRTDTLKTLKENNVRVIILSPAFREDYFISEFSDKNVFVEELVVKMNILEKIFMGLMDILFANVKFSETINIKYRRCKQKKAFFRTKTDMTHLFKGISSHIVSHKNKNLLSAMRKLNVVLFPDRYYKELFKKYKPSLVFTCHTFHGVDITVLKRAIQNGIPTISLIQSWDKLTSKGTIPVKIDKLIVWNERMKKDAFELHGYSPKDVYISGGAQFDIYFKREHLSLREKFFKRIGADPNKKLLTYTVGGPGLYPFDPEIVDIINKHIESGKFGYPCQLLVRVASSDDINRFKKFMNCENIIIESPYRDSSVFHDKWDFSVNDVIHLGDTMLHSDIVINVASTITIEACCVDTPVVNIGFDENEKIPYFDSVVRYYDYTHYRNIVRTGGVRIAKNKEDLLKYINMYLENPKLDSEGRRKIVEEQVYYTDGKSGERIARCILELLNHKGEVSK